jgi:SAM-dependent methyltransferase
MSSPKSSGWSSSGPPEAPAPNFGLQAQRYAAFRPTYPADLYDRLVAAIGAPRRHAIDLGAGTGQATGDLLARFERVTAVEPDPAMAALIAPDPRLDVRVEPAEAALFRDGQADAVVAATALHWMDQDLMVRRAAGWLRPGGGFLAFAYGPARIAAPAAAEHEMLRRYHDWRNNWHERLSAWRPYEGVLRDSGAYRSVTAFSVDVDFHWSGEETAGFFLSTSYGAGFARSTGDELGYGEALARTLEAAAHLGPIHVRFPVEAALAIV